MPAAPLAIMASATPQRGRALVVLHIDQPPACHVVQANVLRSPDGLGGQVDYALHVDVILADHRWVEVRHAWR